MNKYINNFINSTGIVLILVALIGAMQSRILWLDKLSNGLIVSMMVGVVVLILLIAFAKKSFFQKIFSFIDYTKNIYFGDFSYFV